MSVVYAVEHEGKRVEFKANPTNLFPDRPSAEKARESLTGELKNAEIVAYRLSLTIVI